MMPATDAPSSTNTPSYDIFISYRTTRRPWVEVLADNLAAQGYKVFLDHRELVPGANFTRSIFDALKHSRLALLIATPEAAESGWVQEEYEYMFNRAKNDVDFRWIPIVLGEFTDFPFLSNIQAVDFGNSAPDTYRVAFQKLLCGLNNQVPGAAPYFSGTLKFPDTDAPANPERQLFKHERTFVDSVYSYLDSGTPLMVLAQADTNIQHYAHALKTSLQRDYPHETVLHLFPPASTNADSAAYFGRLAKQCGFDEAIMESWEWADALRQRLDEEAEYVLLITGFENGSETARGELAGELRGLLSRYPFSLRLVVMGSERLAAAKYELGKHSFFNDLEEMRLPSVSLEDARAIYLQRYPDLVLDDETLQAMLEFCGQHPRLLEGCLQAVKRGQTDWQTVIQNSPLPSQLFTRFRNDADAVLLCGLLRQDTLGRYDAWPQDKLIRRLYWQNLITHCDGQFVWRGEFIRRMGLELLAC